MSEPLNIDAKKALRAERRAIRRRKRRCFWTWPWGHAIGDGYRCVSCGKYWGAGDYF